MIRGRAKPGKRVWNKAWKRFRDRKHTCPNSLALRVFECELCEDPAVNACHAYREFNPPTSSTGQGTKPNEHVLKSFPFLKKIKVKGEIFLAVVCLIGLRLWGSRECWRSKPYRVAGSQQNLSSHLSLFCLALLGSSSPFWAKMERKRYDIQPSVRREVIRNNLEISGKRPRVILENRWPLQDEDV